MGMRGCVARGVFNRWNAEHLGFGAADLQMQGLGPELSSHKVLAARWL